MEQCFCDMLIPSSTPFFWAPICPSGSQEDPGISTAHFVAWPTDLSQDHRDFSWPTSYLSAELYQWGFGEFIPRWHPWECGKETAAGFSWFPGCIHPGLQLSLWAKFRQSLRVEAEDRFFKRPPEGGNNQLGSSVPVEQAVSCTIGQHIQAVPREGCSGYLMLPVDRRWPDREDQAGSVPVPQSLGSCSPLSVGEPTEPWPLIFNEV